MQLLFFPGLKPYTPKTICSPKPLKLSACVRSVHPGKEGPSLRHPSLCGWRPVSRGRCHSNTLIHAVTSLAISTSTVAHKVARQLTWFHSSVSKAAPVHESCLREPSQQLALTNADITWLLKIMICFPAWQRLCREPLAADLLETGLSTKGYYIIYGSFIRWKNIYMYIYIGTL